MVRFGIDLGGTKTEIAALNAAGEIIYRERLPTPKNDYLKTLQVIKKLVEDAEAVLACTGSVGIGIPGAISKQTGLVKNANSTWLIGRDLSSDLCHLLQREVAIANDANCFVLSEAIDGCAEDAATVFGVIIGTGCGGGLVVNGQIISGINAITGEWGHNPLPWTNADDTHMPCYCGQKGCIETFLSGSGFERNYAHRFDEMLSGSQIVDRALRHGDRNALAHLNYYVEWLAKGLASIINTFDPDVIVLGGGMSNIDYLYEAVPKIWHQWVFGEDDVATRLLKPRYGDSSGVRGAAWLPSMLEQN